MANRTPAEIIIELADGSAVLKDISAEVRSINGFEIEAVAQESQGFGKSWFESLYTGMAKVSPIVLDFFYNDAANTPSTLWTRGATRQFRITWGGAKSSSVSVIMQKFKRSPDNGNLTGGQMTLLPTGVVTEV